jgi:hypothetical protein
MAALAWLLSGAAGFAIYIKAVGVTHARTEILPLLAIWLPGSSLAISAGMRLDDLGETVEGEAATDLDADAGLKSADHQPDRKRAESEHAKYREPQHQFEDAQNQDAKAIPI